MNIIIDLCAAIRRLSGGTRIFFLVFSAFDHEIMIRYSDEMLKVNSS